MAASSFRCPLCGGDAKTFTSVEEFKRDGPIGPRDVGALVFQADCCEGLLTGDVILSATGVDPFIRMTIGYLHR